MEKSVCLATSGRLLLGVDIMTGFSCNDIFSPYCELTHKHTHTHTHTHAYTHTHRQAAAGTLSGEAIFAEITVTRGINPKCQRQFH